MDKNQQSHFLSLYKPVHHQLARYCRAISGNRQDAEDLMNDTILAVIENLDRIKRKDSFKWYIFKIATNLNRIKHRKSKFQAQFNEEEIRHIADTGNNPDAVIEFRMIYEEILALPPRISESLILFHISDLSLEEIQKIQGGSLSGVKLRLKRGRQKLLGRYHEMKRIAIMLSFI